MLPFSFTPILLLMNFVYLLSWALVVSLTYVHACNIWGHDTGYCSELPLDPLWRMENLPWCQYAVLYPACLPKEQVGGYKHCLPLAVELHCEEKNLL